LEPLVGALQVGGDEVIARNEADAMGREPFAKWHANHPEVHLGSFADAGRHGELLVNATNGAGSIEALRSAAGDLDGKVLIDIANPLDFSRGMPPSLFVSNTDSLAEQIQREFPGSRVVKSLNTVTADVMVEPRAVTDGEHTMFLCGNDEGAKAMVAGILCEGFGWEHMLDLGGLAAARGMEAYLYLWLQLMGALDTPMFNISVVT